MEWIILTSEAAFEDIKEAKKWYEEQLLGYPLILNYVWMEVMMTSLKIRRDSRLDMKP